MRALLLGFGWLGAYYLLAQYGVYLLPPDVAARTTLAEYVAMVQILSVLFGVGTVLGVTRNAPGLRHLILPELSKTPRSMMVQIVLPALLGPTVFLAAYGLGMYFAFDTLIAELAARGARAVQAQTGELGRAAAADTLWTILPFTVLLAPLGEELLFRGGIYGAVQAWAERNFEARPASDVAPPSSAVPGVPKRRSNSTKWRTWFRDGGLAWIVSSACFGAMHADTPGGMGIVRVVSASVLGLSCGALRKITGGLFAPLALHAAYNLTSLASVRGWLVSDAFPTKYTIPTALAPLCLVTLTALFGLYLMTRRKRVTTGQ